MDRADAADKSPISCLQLLDSAGRTTGSLPAFAGDPHELLAMYRMMLLARSFDAKAVSLQRTGRLGTYPSCLGHEATHVGVAAALLPEDVMFPVYREVGALLWRGVTMRDLLLYWGGDERGTHQAGPSRDFPFCIPIGSQLPQAAGVAMAMKLRGEARCALAFIGDGGTSQGAFYEALNLAGVRALPLVTVIVNNGWAISMPVREQSASRTLAHKAVAAGMPGLQVDGNDVLAVRQAVAEALARARSGGGPTLIEALTYRLADHTTADDGGRYRPAAEVAVARTLEPLPRTQRYLAQLGLWDEAREQGWRTQCAAAVAQAVDEYLATPPQHTDAMFEFVYAQAPAGLQPQRDTARRHPGRS